MMVVVGQGCLRSLEVEVVVLCGGDVGWVCGGQAGLMKEKQTDWKTSSTSGLGLMNSHCVSSTVLGALCGRRHLLLSTTL